MKIHDGSHSLRPKIQPNSTPPKPEKSGNGGSAPIKQASVNTQSTENLLATIGDVSEIRETLVQEIKLKLQAGEYLTQKAAVETADAILNL